MHKMGKRYEFLLPTSLIPIFQICMAQGKNTRPRASGLDIPLPALPEAKFMFLHRLLTP